MEAILRKVNFWVGIIEFFKFFHCRFIWKPAQIKLRRILEDNIKRSGGQI